MHKTIPTPFGECTKQYQRLFGSLRLVRDVFNEFNSRYGWNRPVPPGMYMQLRRCFCKLPRAHRARPNSTERRLHVYLSSLWTIFHNEDSLLSKILEAYLSSVFWHNENRHQFQRSIVEFSCLVWMGGAGTSLAHADRSLY